MFKIVGKHQVTVDYSLTPVEAVKAAELSFYPEEEGLFETIEFLDRFRVGHVTPKDLGSNPFNLSQTRIEQTADPIVCLAAQSDNIFGRDNRSFPRGSTAKVEVSLIATDNWDPTSLVNFIITELQAWPTSFYEAFAFAAQVEVQKAFRLVPFAGYVDMRTHGNVGLPIFTMGPNRKTVHFTEGYSGASNRSVYMATKTLE